MTEISNPKQFTLEERTYQFAVGCRLLVKKAPRTLRNLEDCKQLTRSSGSVAANYIEANESLGKKDFLMHIKICKKESKESGFWLRLMEFDDSRLETERNNLVQESIELMKIFGAVLVKST